MKKQILLLAGSALILASCGSNNNSGQNEQAKMDSIANANKALQDQINQKKNDSTINAMAAAKADSIEKANAKEHAGTKTTHTKTTTTTTSKETTPAPAPAPAPTGMRAHSDQSKTAPADNNTQQQSGGGMRSHSDQSKTK